MSIFTISKNNFYKLVLKFKKNTKYKSSILDIPNFPNVEIPNILFTKLYKIERVDELNSITSNTVYFKAMHNNTIELGKEVESSEIDIIDEKTFIRSVNLNRLRILHDLRLIKYYLDLDYHKTSFVFVDRFYGHYKFFCNPNCLEGDLLINNIYPSKSNNRSIKVLYLIFFSPIYEDIGYTIRTHNLIKNANYNENIDITGVSRYGYPFDKLKEYYEDKINETKREGVTYLKLTDKEDNFNNNNLYQYLQKYINNLIKLAQDMDIDIIHAASNWWNGIVAYYAAKVLGIKSIYELRGFWDESSIAFKPELHMSDMQVLKRNMEKFVLEHVDQVITINDNLKDEIDNRTSKLTNKIEILYNGVDTDKFTPDGFIRGKIKNKYGIDNNCVVIGYIGSILNYEGIEYIIKSLNNLVLKYQIKFFLIGDGKEKNNIMKLINNLNLQDRVIYLGKIKHKEVTNFYNMFDIVAYPRKDMKVCRTTCSSKIFEAMSMRRAIVVSKLPAYNEIVEDNVNGLYCEPDSVQSLTNKLRLLIESKELRERLGCGARRWVVNNKNWKIVGNQLSKIYERLVMEA